MAKMKSNVEIAQISRKTDLSNIQTIFWDWSTCYFGAKIENFQDTTDNSEFHHLIKVQKWLGTRLENFQNTNGTVSSKPSKVSKSFLQFLSES